MKDWSMESILSKQLQVTGGAGKLIDLQVKDKPKASKYGNKKTVVDGILWDSLKEAQRYGDLKLVAKVGHITELRWKERFEIIIGGMKVCSYISDFSYIRDGRKVVEDVKSEATKRKESYRLKKKLMLAVHGIEIIEI